VLHKYEWLPEEEHWRAAVAWRQRRWLPQWVRDHVWEHFFEDFEQLMAMIIFISYVNRLDLAETRKAAGREIRGFLKALGITARHGKGWTTVESTSGRADISEQSNRLISEMCRRTLVSAIEERRPKLNLQNLHAGPKMGIRTCINCGRDVWAEQHMKYCGEPECRRAGAALRKLRFNEKRKLIDALPVAG
jgi:hypothetical protein